MFVMITLCLSSCAYAIRYDGPYEGRVIDAETKQPIEGVVVLGVWNKEEPNVAGVTTTYYDAKETVTDINGEFIIQGLGLKMSYVGTMNFLIFKAGYMYLSGPWESLKESFYYKEKVKWEGEKAIISLKKLTMEERRKHNPPSPPGQAPKEKVLLMLKEMDKDLKDQGMKPFMEKGWR